MFFFFSLSTKVVIVAITEECDGPEAAADTQPCLKEQTLREGLGYYSVDLVGIWGVIMVSSCDCR